jgi:PIN domain nuclease of toxin-antitoxin system
MRYLLNTHIFLWMIVDRDRVRPAVLRELDDPENEIFYSSVVSWEIETKKRSGKLHFSGSPSGVARRIGLIELPVSAAHSEIAANLEGHHKDPFDRLLIAQAMVEELILVTHDAKLHAYNVPMLRV